MQNYYANCSYACMQVKVYSSLQESLIHAAVSIIGFDPCWDFIYNRISYDTIKLTINLKITFHHCYIHSKLIGKLGQVLYNQSRI